MAVENMQSIQEIAEALCITRTSTHRVLTRALAKLQATGEIKNLPVLIGVTHAYHEDARRKAHHA